MKEKKINLIIYRLSAMGDVSMMVPLILALKQEYKDIRITVVSNVFFRPFFQVIDSVDFIGIDTSNKHKGFWGIFKIFKEIDALRPTHFADLHSSLRSRIIIFLLKFSRVKSFSLNKGRGEKKALVRVENKIFKPLQHTLYRYQEVLQRLGFQTNLEKPNFLIQEKIPEKYAPFFNKDSKAIGIAPFAKHEAKTYPLRLMQEVINQLAIKKENFIFLFGGKNELQALKGLKGLHTNVLVVTSSFQEELALISNLSVMLSMDSGNGHLAAMYGVKTITIWGGTHPFAGFSPYFQPIENSIVPDNQKFPSLPNSIFGNQMSDEVKKALESISPDEVVTKINQNITPKK